MSGEVDNGEAYIVLDLKNERRIWTNNYEEYLSDGYLTDSYIVYSREKWNATRTKESLYDSIVNQYGSLAEFLTLIGIEDESERLLCEQLFSVQGESAC